ncbi:MAG: fibronectin type III domain-containing protein [Planctomycetota bacterium]
MSLRIALFRRLLGQPKQPRGRSARRPRSLSLERIGIDQLEARQMLSVSPWTPAAETAEQGIVNVATPHFLRASAGGTAGPLGMPGPTGYSPSLIRHAYGFDAISFGSVAANGAGTTIAIVDAFDNPNIESDLKQFDLAFGLPAPPSFIKVNQFGGSTMPAVDKLWASETALDVEWAHAIAPGASILLVEAASDSMSDLIAAVDYARSAPGVIAVSMSWGSSEFRGESTFDATFTTPSGHGGVAFFASSGDSGAPASYPSASPNCVSVGGTSLSISSGKYLSESGWSGSGGGISRYESQPAYQTGTVTQSTTMRGNPDVAYNSDPDTGFPVYDSLNNDTSTPWSQVGGTSAAAPQWAALTAIVDQGRALAGLGSLDGPEQLLPALYKVAAIDFHDVTTGGSDGSPSYPASAGYDLVTGRGTPVANLLIADLVAWEATPVAMLPGAPSGLVAVAGSRQARLSWQAPATNGFPILDYAIESSADGGATWIPFVHAASAATSATIDNLSNGGRYRFRVAAINSAGRGEFAYTSTDTIPFDVPAAPTLQSAVAGPGQVSLAWAAPEVDGGNQVTDYVVQVLQAGWNWTTWNDGVSASTTTIIQPLQGNTAYSFRVAAVNAAGTGLFTELSALQTVLPVASVPTAPLNLSAAPAGDAAILSWQTPASSGSSPISDYSIEYSSDHAASWKSFAHAASTATAAQVPSLETGKGYLFRVTAVNSEGASVAAVASVSLPAAPPPAPTLLMASAGAGLVVLSWKAPQFAGGSPLTGYALQSSTDGGLSWSQRETLSPTATSAVVNGLVGGQAISFRLAAVNLIGTGASSAPTAPVVPTVPITVPAAATNVVANVANTTQKWISWNTPLSNGGSPIRDYTVQYSSNSGQTWTTVVHAPSAATAVLVSGLSTRFRYSFRVAAVSDVGTGAFAYPAPPPSTQPAKPATVAGAPTKLSVATTGTGTKTLNWQAPASGGGSAITTYVVQYAAIGGGWVTVAHAPSAATSLVVSGLNPRLRYSFRVAAVNSVGTGAFVRA